MTDVTLSWHHVTLSWQYDTFMRRQCKTKSWTFSLLLINPCRMCVITNWCWSQLLNLISSEFTKHLSSQCCTFCLIIIGAFVFRTSGQMKILTHLKDRICVIESNLVAGLDLFNKLLDLIQIRNNSQITRTIEIKLLLMIKIKNSIISFEHITLKFRSSVMRLNIVGSWQNLHFLILNTSS